MRGFVRGGTIGTIAETQARPASRRLTDEQRAEVFRWFDVEIPADLTTGAELCRRCRRGTLCFERHVQRSGIGTTKEQRQGQVVAPGPPAKAVQRRDRRARAASQHGRVCRVRLDVLLTDDSTGPSFGSTHHHLYLCCWPSVHLVDRLCGRVASRLATSSSNHRPRADPARESRS